MGPAFVVILLPAWYSMGFLPPVPPSLSAAEVAALYEEHRTGIRLGATLTMQFCIFGVAWTAAVAAQMRRIEGDSTPLLTYLQLACGTIGFMVLMIAPFAWTTAAFRPERAPELVYLFNDFAWLALIMPVMPAALQALAIAAATLSDRRAEPIFPRWSAYLNLWAAVVFLPGALATFFKTGPFAWNGLFDFWLPLTVFCLWLPLMAVLVTQAARRQAREEAAATAA
jgi:hypothetical protein